MGDPRYPKLWDAKNNMLVRTFVFSNFIEAVHFVNDIATIAEQMNHHPDIEIFSYKNVKVKLTTHSAGNTVTKKDVSMAEEIDKQYTSSNQPAL
ncbi:4a-hydroxytetrahydrobiopterin dehydratase [Candidatus Woesearchaeota archaeon]|nr:4a-hydroxytetrahydrobiopterin dehydratase [Candidatus Woesearchaeota archaeon]